MVLRGQPVGEQGAADRWTALDPYAAGSGAGAPRGHPLRGAPFLFSPYRSAEGPPGPFSMPRGPLLGVALVLLHSFLIGMKGPFRVPLIVIA